MNVEVQEEPCLLHKKLLPLYLPMSGMMKKSWMLEAAPAQSDQRKVEYSVEKAEIGFHFWGQDQSFTGSSTVDWQHWLDQLWTARGQSNITLPQPKCSQSQLRNWREDGWDDDAQRQAVKHEHERSTKAAESNHRVDDCPRRGVPTKNMQPTRQLKRRIKQPSNQPWKMMKRRIRMTNCCVHLKICHQVQDLCSHPSRRNVS